MYLLKSLIIIFGNLSEYAFMGFVDMLLVCEEGSWNAKF